MSPINLGIVTGALSPAAGGLFESVRVPANKLAEAGVELSVYGTREPQFDRVREAWCVPHLHPVPLVGPLRLSYTPGMLRQVMAANHDLVHQHGIWIYQSHVVDSWRRKTGRPTIVSPRGMLDPWALRNSSLKKLVFKTLYEDRNLESAAVIHALNESEADAIRAYGLKAPIAVIANGIDLPDPNRPIARPSWMQDDDRKVLLFLGRIHPKKGLSELIAAWREVRDVGRAVFDGWRIVIGGWDDGDHRSALEREVAAADLAGHIAFAGPLMGDVKASALHHASAFILPSHSEGMPMSVLEAWSYRRPVFMTRACNLSKGFVAGAAFEIAVDPHEMSAILVERLSATHQLENAGQAGYALVDQNYTWDRIVTDMQQLYAWVLGRGETPGFVRVR